MIDKNLKNILIYSGSNPRALISFLRFLDQKGLKYHIIANGSNDSIFQTAYSKSVVFTRKYNHLCIDELIALTTRIAAETSSRAGFFVLPSTEYLNRFLLRNRILLEQHQIKFGLCEEELYSKISDKLSFTDLCEKNNLPVPQQFDTLPSVYPFVAKYKHYLFDKKKTEVKPILVFNEKDKAQFVEEFATDLDSFFYQEYIQGDSFYLLFHFSKDGSYVVFSQENLIQQKDGGSMILAKSSTLHENKELSEGYASIFKHLCFEGLVMVEVKKKGSNYVMIEANPRLWGPSQLILDAKMNLFDYYIINNELINTYQVENNYKSGVYYFWSGGFFQNQNSMELCKFYNFTQEEFCQNYPQILTNEIYLKIDTLNIYYNENRKEHLG